MTLSPSADPLASRIHDQAHFVDQQHFPHPQDFGDDALALLPGAISLSSVFSGSVGGGGGVETGSFCTVDPCLSSTLRSISAEASEETVAQQKGSHTLHLTGPVLDAECFSRLRTGKVYDGSSPALKEAGQRGQALLVSNSSEISFSAREVSAESCDVASVRGCRGVTIGDSTAAGCLVAVPSELSCESESTVLDSSDVSVTVGDELLFCSFICISGDAGSGAGTPSSMV